MSRRVLFITNPRSRHGQDAGEAAEAMRAAGLAVDHRTPESPDDVLATIREHAQEADMVVIGAGDGTISLAAPALLDCRRPLGVLPMGTANDLARSLGIPADIEGAIEVLRGGHTQRIDLGCVNGRPFFNAVSIGLGAQVADMHDGPAKRWLGVVNYPFVLIRALRRHRPSRAVIDCDGEVTRGRFLHIAVGNGRHHGGGLTVSEQAAIDDGMLDLYAVRAASWHRLLPLLPALRSGTEANGELTRLRGRRIAIETRRPVPFNVDGELDGETPVDITLLPAALEVVTPGGSVPGPAQVSEEKDAQSSHSGA